MAPRDDLDAEVRATRERAEAEKACAVLRRELLVQRLLEERHRLAERLAEDQRDR